jgi:hypothetical protein
MRPLIASNFLRETSMDSLPFKSPKLIDLNKEYIKKPICAFDEALRHMNLDGIEKLVLHSRFISLLREYERRCIFYAIVFHVCRILVTVGSLIVPALLSIQYTDTSTSTSSNSSQPFQYQIYWATWVISLLVTTSNGIATVFKIEKKYYFLHTTLEQLRSEGWQYVMLTGRYSGFYTQPDAATHKNQYVFFCHTIEKIKMKQVTEEYFKIEDQKDIQTNIQKHTTSASSISHGDAIKLDLQGPTLVSPTPSPQKQSLLFSADSLIPPTPLQATLTQLLQALSIDGGRPQESKQVSTAKQKNEVSVRTDVSSATAPKESFLSESQGHMLEQKSVIRMGTEIPASKVEQQLQTTEDP